MKRIIISVYLGIHYIKLYMLKNYFDIVCEIIYDLIVQKIYSYLILKLALGYDFS